MLPYAPAQNVPYKLSDVVLEVINRVQRRSFAVAVSQDHKRKTRRMLRRDAYINMFLRERQ